MIVLSYIYGARFDSKDIIDFCNKNGIFVVEDEAESFSSPTHTGSKNADATLFSYGTIKTNTAFGGAITVIRNNKNLFQKMNQI